MAKEGEGCLFDSLILQNFTSHRVTDKSSEVYFTKDGFGVGITKKGEFTLNANNKRLNFRGLSGIMLYDRDNPEKLYSLELKNIDKAGFSGECRELGVTADVKVRAKDFSIGFSAEIKSEEKKNITLAFCFPADGSTALDMDKQIWIYDFGKAVECEKGKEYITPMPGNSSLSRYPFGAMMNRFVSFAIATSPLAKDSRFMFFRDLRTFANVYDLSLDKDTVAETDFEMFKYSYLWGMRGVYDRYVALFSSYFPNKEDIKGFNLKDVDNFDISFKSLLSYDGYRVKGPLSEEDIYFIKCVAKNKPVYYVTDEENFASEYPKAVLYGFIPEYGEPLSPENSRIVAKLKPVYDIVQSSVWDICPQSESNNRNVISEKYYRDGKSFVVSFNNSAERRVAFLELLEYNGVSSVKNLADNSDYNIKNKTVDIVFEPYGMSVFGY